MPLKHAMHGCSDSSGLLGGCTCASVLENPLAADSAITTPKADVDALKRLRELLALAGRVDVLVGAGAGALKATGPRPNMPAWRITE
jgi:hypothetical protein